MRSRFTLVASAALLSLCGLAAHADIVTNFTLTHGQDTLQFSLSDSTPYTFRLATFNVSEFTYRVPVNVNGTTYSPLSPTYAEVGFESQQAPGIGAELFVAFNSAIVNGVTPYSDYFELGKQVYTSVNGVPVFTAETVTFPDGFYVTRDGETHSSSDTLVITKTDTSMSAAPEPSTLALLATGLVSGMGVIRRCFGR